MFLRLCLLATACLVSTFVDADVFKCRNSAGTVSYSDQPCADVKNSLPVPDVSPSAGANSPQQTPQPSQPQSVPATTLTQDIKNSQTDTTSNTETNPPAPTEQNPDFLSYDKDFYKHKDLCNQGNMDACNMLFKTVNKVIDNKCNEGDKESCAMKYCGSAAKGVAPASDFIACAKYKGMPYGKYWSITHGKPQFNQPVEWQYIKKIENGTEGLNPLELTCFRKKASFLTVQSTVKHAFETLHITNNANGSAVNFTFALGSERGWYETISPEYKSLEELAMHHCER